MLIAIIVTWGISLLIGISTGTLVRKIKRGEI